MGTGKTGEDICSSRGPAPQEWLRTRGYLELQCQQFCSSCLVQHYLLAVLAHFPSATVLYCIPAATTSNFCGHSSMRTLSCQQQGRDTVFYVSGTTRQGPWHAQHNSITQVFQNIQLPISMSYGNEHSSQLSLQKILVVPFPQDPTNPYTSLPDTLFFKVLLNIDWEPTLD